MKLTSIPEKIPKTLGIMTILPKQRINVNSSSLPSSCKKITVIILVTMLFVSAFCIFRHFHHVRGHHLKKGRHHVGRPHHVGHGTGSDGKDKIKQAIDANLEAIKSRAGNIYVDNESEALNHPKKDDAQHHDDDHEDDDYEEDDDEYDDDDDDDDDDDEDEYEDEKKDNKEAPK